MQNGLETLQNSLPSKRNFNHLELLMKKDALESSQLDVLNDHIGSRRRLVHLFTSCEMIVWARNGYRHDAATFKSGMWLSGLLLLSAAECCRPHQGLTWRAWTREVCLYHPR